MTRILLILCLFLFAGCLDIGSIEVQQKDILIIPLNVLPSGYRIGTTYRESEQGSRNAFKTWYNYDITSALLYWFIQYPNENAAMIGYERYMGAAFYVGLGSDYVWDVYSDKFLLNSTNYDEYDLRCRNPEKNDIDMQYCSVRLRYGQCVLQLGSKIHSSHLEMSEFIEILDYINTNMPNISICYSS